MATPGNCPYVDSGAVLAVFEIVMNNVRIHFIAKKFMQTYFLYRMKINKLMVRKVVR